MNKDQEIAYLKEIIELQRKLIDQLSPQSITTTTINLPFLSIARCHDGCEYPQPWFGTTPPACKKCGNQAYNPTVTCNVSQE